MGRPDFLPLLRYLQADVFGEYGNLYAAATHAPSGSRKSQRCQFRKSARSGPDPDQPLAGCGALFGAPTTLLLATRATGAECVASQLGRGPFHPGTALPLTPKTT